MAGTPGKEMHHGQHAGRERGPSCPRSGSPPGHQCHFASPITQISHRAQPNLRRQAAGSFPLHPLRVPSSPSLQQEPSGSGPSIDTRAWQVTAPGSNKTLLTHSPLAISL